MKEKSGLVSHQDEEIAFIAANFSYKECTVYVEDDSKKGSCRCGLPRDEHSPEVLKREASKWSITHIATHKPTFIYGTHTMPNGHQIKFLRLADSDDPTKLLELMCNYWEMKNDAALTLVLSLITSPSGGIPEDVEEGLTHSVCVNSCWIISSGMAPMEKLEELGRKRLNENHGKFHYCNICIEPWRQELLQLWQGHSSDSKEMTKFKAYTHCLFIDNGQQKESSVSVTNEYQHRLEELIREGLLDTADFDLQI
ncbi:unnamed protein product [Dibothriocephalus latus]|uniref:TRPM SLOG domain-containing protein n=1 Tax=Dibothriocephalus latus TaxID=60516 RepID=A0A3P6T5F3_DIBLA|nr:unnamed protein product [Dibothriocephalus latus]